MNGELLQNALVALIVLSAAVFLVMRRVRARRRASPLCGDCPGCATAKAEPPLVKIGELPLVKIGEPPRAR